MFGKPAISRLRLPIHGSLHVSEEGWSGTAETVASPHMLAMEVHLIVKVMVHCDVEPSYLVYIPHDLLKLATMSAFSETCRWVSEEEEGVDHLVQQCLFEFIPRAVLQKRSRELNGTGVITGMCAGASTEGHLLAPLHIALLESLLKEELVVVAKHLVDVKDLVIIVTPEEFILHFPPIIPASNTHTFNQQQPSIFIKYPRSNHPIDVRVLASVLLLLSSSFPFERLRLQCFLADVMAQRRFSKTASREYNTLWEATSWLQGLCFFGLRAIMM